ncbi:MAG: SDR family NAD(P)-dependent oxidoreductase [Bacteroidota bacterium]
MNFDLSNKVAVITGGGSGIGKGIARTFADHGAYVHVLDLNEAEGNDVVRELRGKKLRAAFHQADVTQPEAIDDIFKKIYDENSKINILVNSAGISHIGTVETTSAEDLDRIYNVNVKGVYTCLRAGVTYMKKSRGGVILNIASIVASVGIPDRFAYSMSKGAVLTMTYSVAADFIKDNIRCNSVAPARVHTSFVDNFLKKNYPGKEAEMFEKLSKTQPIGRMGTPEEVASMALYLCSDEASFITGCNFPVDGGFTTIKL